MTGCDVKTWTPALSCKVPDHIISSQFASKKVFVPSYEKYVIFYFELDF